MNTTINPSNGNNSDKKKNVAAHVATAAAAAGLGVAGAMAMDSDQEVTPVPEEVQEISEDAEAQSQQNQPNATAPSANNHTNSSSQSPATSGSANATVPNEPQPVTEESEDVIPDVEEEIIPGDSEPDEPLMPEDPESQPQQNPTDSEDPDNTDVIGLGILPEDDDIIDMDDEITNIDAESDPITAQDTNDGNPEGAVNPDDVAEAIISEEQIDPNDIDMENVVNFDEIDTVYTVEGESHTAAEFHDAAGNQLVMVDVDDDNVFDIVTDTEGNPLTDPSGNYVAAGDLTVDDAEIGISDNPTYLAADDTDATDEFGADSIANDLIS